MVAVCTKKEFFSVSLTDYPITDNNWVSVVLTFCVVLFDVGVAEMPSITDFPYFVREIILVRAVRFPDQKSRILPI